MYLLQRLSVGPKLFNHVPWTQGLTLVVPLDEKILDLEILAHFLGKQFLVEHVHNPDAEPACLVLVGWSDTACP